jgi:hypothetical protein
MFDGVIVKDVQIVNTGTSFSLKIRVSDAVVQIILSGKKDEQVENNQYSEHCPKYSLYEFPTYLSNAFHELVFSLNPNTSDILTSKTSFTFSSGTVLPNSLCIEVTALSSIPQGIMCEK